MKNKVICETVTTIEEVIEVIKNVRKNHQYKDSYYVGISSITNLDNGEIRLEIPISENKDNFKDIYIELVNSKEEAVKIAESIINEVEINKFLTIYKPIYNEFKDGRVLLQLPVEKEMYINKSR